jgi:hypothetical protein
MDFVDRGDDRPEPISIARCRELLGDEADTLTDQDVELIRRHAETMAQVVVQMYVESRRIPGNHRAFSTHLARAHDWV